MASRIAEVHIRPVQNAEDARLLLPRTARLSRLALAVGLHVTASALILILLKPLMAAPQGTRLEGTVRDSSGGAVPGAQVTVTSGATSLSSSTDRIGRFAFERVQGESGSIAVAAKGFARYEGIWTAQAGAPTRLDIVLVPAPLWERLVVTASRTEVRLSDTAADLVVLTPENLSTTPALMLDDALRQVPGFSLFRRSGSRTANPTSQGVSLRGVGASGASRALVLADSIPLNDPFGGWIYWDRIPRESISDIEVLRGAASSLYGTDALGGVINLITLQPASSTASLEAGYGNEQTPDLSVSAGARRGRWAAQASGEAFRTDGYIIVDRSERGPVDTPARSAHAAGDMTLERFVSERARLFLRGSVLSERRHNGTPLQPNRTHIRSLAVGGDWQPHGAGSLSLRMYGGPQVFDQYFSAVTADRSTESLTRSQRVPARQLGGSAQWLRVVGARQTVVAGVEAREVRGSSDELAFLRGRIDSAIGAAGRERREGVFGEDLLRITPRWRLALATRVDHWRNYDAFETTRQLARPGPTAVTAFPDRTETAVSPSVSIARKARENVSVSASAYRAFRAPTLNELYRSFRVGDVVTLSNDALRAERLSGAETGVHVAASSRLDFRGTFFWNDITRPIANVTLTVAPGLITRQRQNLGRTRSRGFDLNAQAHLTSTVDLSAGYQFADARVLRFPADSSLEGLLIPLVPRHQFTFRASYSNPRRVTAAVQGRFSSREFDDDQNRFLLDHLFTLEALISRSVGHGMEVFAAGENLLNQRYVVGRTPVSTIGPPLLARVGIRVRLGRP